MTEVLALEGVVKRYRRGRAPPVDVLAGVDLTVSAGEIVGLVAPSGAGKSTLLHISGLLDMADAGQVRVAGEPASRLSDRARTALRRDRVGFVYQFHHLLGEFTALENVMLPQLSAGAGHGAAAARAEALLARVGLAERARHRPGELSGGEQQRVAFCRALANGPSLLLADDPTGNLDPATSDRVFEALVDLVRDHQMGALVATHNLALAARMDRVLTLASGRASGATRSDRSS